jgi:hypothetical protein
LVAGVYEQLCHSDNPTIRAKLKLPAEIYNAS